jgi:hypothetical protein
MLIVLLSIAYFVLDKSDKKHQKSTEREKKEDIIVSDKFAEYIGGFPDVSGGKRAYITVKQNEIEIVLSPFANTIKKVIPMEVITNAEIKSESQITNEVTLGRMLLLGPLAFAFKKEKSIVKNYLVISCKKQDKEISLIFKTGSISEESIVNKIREIKNITSIF